MAWGLQGLQINTKDKMGSDFYNSSDLTFTHDPCYPSFSLLPQFPYYLTLKHRHSLINLPRHSSPIFQEASCVIPNECDIFNSRSQVGSKCNTILSGINQIVLETLFQIPKPIYFLVKITEYK